MNTDNMDFHGKGFEGKSSKQEAHEFLPIVPPRALTPEEQEILNGLLSVDFFGRDELLRQVPSIQVVEECKACRSIVILVDRLPENRANVRQRVPVDAQGLDSDGGTMHILLHVVHGYMDEMEIYREDLQSVKALPRPASLLINVYGAP